MKMTVYVGNRVENTHFPCISIYIIIIRKKIKCQHSPYPSPPIIICLYLLRLNRVRGGSSSSGEILWEVVCRGSLLQTKIASKEAYKHWVVYFPFLLIKVWLHFSLCLFHTLNKLMPCGTGDFYKSASQLPINL